MKRPAPYPTIWLHKHRWSALVDGISKCEVDGCAHEEHHQSNGTVLLKWAPTRDSAELADFSPEQRQWAADNVLVVG